MIVRVAFVALILLLSVRALAWNAFGHRAVCEIAWRQLNDDERQRIVQILRRHPRFDADFASKMPDDVLSGDRATQDRWIFQTAGYWPDVARGTVDDRPWWHFINLPLYLEPKDEQLLAGKLTFNQSFDYPQRATRLG
jgi:hypothetical protein